MTPPPTWLAPNVEATIGEETRPDTVLTMEVCAERTSPVAHVALELSNLHGEWDALLDALFGVDLTTGEVPLVLRWGWQGEDAAPLFDGALIQCLGDYRSLRLTGLCRADALARTRITRTYQNMTASQVVSDLVAPLGFSAVDIAEDATLLDLLPLRDETVASALRRIEKRLALGVAWWCDASGAFHWGPEDLAQAPVATFTHGDDVLDFVPLPGGRYLLTVMGASVWHSQSVTLVGQDGATRTYYAESVRHTLGLSGEGARSRLTLREVASD